jgi:hypothetical protein
VRFCRRLPADEDHLLQSVEQREIVIARNAENFGNAFPLQAIEEETAQRRGFVPGNRFSGSRSVRDQGHRSIASLPSRRLAHRFSYPFLPL